MVLLLESVKNIGARKPSGRCFLNEKYIGDALLQKKYTVDFLTKSESRMRVLFLSITYKTVMKGLFLRTFLYRYKKKC